MPRLESFRYKCIQCIYVEIYTEVWLFFTFDWFYHSSHFQNSCHAVVFFPRLEIKSKDRSQPSEWVHVDARKVENCQPSIVQPTQNDIHFKLIHPRWAKGKMMAQRCQVSGGWPLKSQLFLPCGELLNIKLWQFCHGDTAVTKDALKRKLVSLCSDCTITTSESTSQIKLCWEYIKDLVSGCSGPEKPCASVGNGSMTKRQGAKKSQSTTQRVLNARYWCRLRAQLHHCAFVS